MTTASARPDLASYNEALRLDPPVLVKELRSMLGAQLVAYLGGVEETRAVRQWADGQRDISSAAVLDRLRLAFQIAKMLTQHDSPAVVQAWFQGLNPTLDDWSPARLLREGSLAETGPQVLTAAREFAATSG